MIVFLYNSQPQDSLNGNTPFELLFLRKQRDCFETETIENLNKKWSEFGMEGTEIFNEIVKIHAHNFDLNKIRIGSPPTKLRKNERVLVFKPLGIGQVKKCSRKWVGPFRVVKSTAQDVYLLRNERSNRRLKRNIKFIRKIPQKSNPRLVAENISGLPKIQKLLDSNENEPSADTSQNLPTVETQNSSKSVTRENEPRDAQREVESPVPCPVGAAEPTADSAVPISLAGNPPNSITRTKRSIRLPKRYRS